MNLTLSVALFLSLSFIPNSIFCSVQKINNKTVTGKDQTFPWTGTFLGINAPPATIQAATTPLQTISAPSQSTPSLQFKTSNPFYTPPSAVSSQTNQTTTQSITKLLTNASTPSQQKINAAFTTNTTVGGDPLKITSRTKYQATPAATAIKNLGGMSFTQVQKNVKSPIQPLFPNNPALTTAYNNFMNAMQDCPSFLPLFKKLHIVALHEIYIYLTGIYTSLNMTHIDDLKTYILTEKKYALNKKTIIINHLINVIMAQLNQAIRALMPGMPEPYAIHSGMLCLQNDMVSDPNLFILDLEKSVLAVIGLEKIDSAQLIAAYNALKLYSNLNTSSQKVPQLVTINPGSDLQIAMNQLLNNDFSTKLLSPNQRTALVNALDTIVAYLINQQSITFLQIVADNLLNKPNAQQPTTDQLAQFSKFIAQCVYQTPLSEEIAAAKTFATMIGTTRGTASTTPLNKDQLKILRGVLSYILQQYETLSVQGLTTIIQTLGELNPAYQTLSPSQSLALKGLATQMLAATPLLLQDLSDDQRQNLAYGLWVTANSSSALSSSQKEALQNLAILLKKGPLSEQSLSQSSSQNNLFASSSISSDQKTALQFALSLFIQYQLAPISMDDFGQTVQNTPPSSLLSDQDLQDTVQKSLAIINSSSFTSFAQLTQNEQIIMLQLFQNLAQIFETRLEQHLNESTELAYLFSDSPAVSNALFNGILPGHYETLNYIDAFIESHETFSLNDIANLQTPSTIDPNDPNAWINPQKALQLLFLTNQTPAAAPSQGAPSTNTSYLSLLLQLQEQHFQNQAILTVASQIAADDITSYKQALPLLVSPNFTFSQLTTPLKQSLAQTTLSYIKALQSDASTVQKGRAPLDDPNDSSLETVANVIRFTDQYTSMKNSFLGVLEKYLVFFNLYAQTLQNSSDDPTHTPYAGLTAFASYAQNIQQSLQYQQTGKKQEMVQLIEQTNPPLFFYDAAVFRGIRLLPKLAVLVENSSIAPYPSFGIEQAALGSSIDPLTGKSVPNTASIGSFQYKKFFFLQAPDAITEMTGSLPSWIQKVTVPASKGTTSTLYEPLRIPSDGITGFYMNIPTFQQDPNNGGAALVRLYEQPIIAQPAWLNSSGTGPTTPKSGIIPAANAGVVTVLRGCLGDFQSILDLGIFDPCLTVIFKAALAINNTNLPSTSAQSPFSPQDTTACAAYIQEKQTSLEHQNNPVPEPATALHAPAGATITMSGVGA